MNNLEIENKLSALRVKRLAPFARTRILAAARAAWAATPATRPAWGWNFWRWPAGTALAASIVFFISIVAIDFDRALTDDLVASSIPFQKINLTVTVQSAVESDRNPHALRPIVIAALRSPATTRVPEWQDIFFKQLVLNQNIGLSRNGG